MIKIGITGGIGSGKSIVTELLLLYGIPCFIADSKSKQIVDNSEIIRKQLTALFGSGIYTPDGLDRKQLASYIFQDTLLLNQVNKIIHPVVSDAFLQWADAQKSEFTVLESAILFESGFDHLVDITVTISAPLALRTERACKRDKCDANAIKQRIKNQITDEEKEIRADYIMQNSSKTSLIKQVEAFITAITQKKSDCIEKKSAYNLQI